MNQKLARAGNPFIGIIKIIQIIPRESVLDYNPVNMFPLA